MVTRFVNLCVVDWPFCWVSTLHASWSIHLFLWHMLIHACMPAVTMAFLMHHHWSSILPVVLKSKQWWQRWHDNQTNAFLLHQIYWSKSASFFGPHLSQSWWLIDSCIFDTCSVLVLLAARLFVQNCGFGVCWCCDCDSRKQENHLSPLWSTFWLCGSQHQHCYTILPWPMAHKIIHDLYKSLQCTCKTMLGVLFGYCSCCCHWLCQHFCSKNTQQCSNNLAWSINIVGHMICLLLLIEKLVLSSVTWLLWRDQEGTEWFPRTGSQ